MGGEEEKKHKISVCMGSSCFSRGNSKNLAVIEQFLTDHNLKADVELAGCRCQNCCSEGPNVAIDDEKFNGVDAGTLLDLLNKKLKGDK